MAAMGHEERFPSPSLSGRCRLGEATFAGMGDKGGGCAESSPSSQSAAPSGRDGPYGGSAKRKLAAAVDPNDRSLVDRIWQQGAANVGDSEAGDSSRISSLADKRTPPRGMVGSS